MTEAAVSRAGIAIVLVALALGPAAAEDASPSTDTGDAGALTPALSRGERGEPDEASQGPALDGLERELAEVMDELVAARARAGVLARSLFRTGLEVEVMRRADAQVLGQLRLRLDGAPVHESDGSTLASGRATLFTGYLAPGMHELAIEVVERARERPAFAYARSERFQIEVRKGRRTRVELVLRDDSDMAEEAAEGDEGEYQVATELRVSYQRTRD